MLSSLVITGPSSPAWGDVPDSAEKEGEKGGGAPPFQVFGCFYLCQYKKGDPDAGSPFSCLALKLEA